MNNEWLNNLRGKMEDHEEDVPEGLWDDIREELFSGEEENNLIPGLSAVANDEVEKKKSEAKVGYQSLLYRIGGIAAAAVLVFIIVKVLPQDDENKTISQNILDSNKGVGSKVFDNHENTSIERDPGMSAPFAQNNSKTTISGKKIKTIKLEEIRNTKQENSGNDWVIIKNPETETLVQEDNKIFPNAPLVHETPKVSGNETDKVLFEKEKIEEKFADNKKNNAVKSQKDRSWMLSMLTGNASSNSAEQQFPGYASINGKPMNIEQVWSASEYVDDPLTEILLANQSKPVEARIRHKIPVTFGLSLYYNLGKRWGIGTGVNYTKLSSELHSGSSENYIKGNQTVHYVGIPVQVNYNVIQKGKFTGYVTGGVLLEKPVSGSITTTYVVDDEVKETSKESLENKPLQFSVNAAAGLQLKVINRLGIYAEPGIGYHFKDENSPNTIYREKPLHFNLKFGVRLLID